MDRILICDPTLRDGNHAVMHQINQVQIANYCRAADVAGIPLVEVGHGNGLSASSLQFGQSLVPDLEMIAIARENLSNSKLEVFVVPGFATINRDLAPAIDLGVDSVRVGAHCTEADTTARHISYVRERGRNVYGSLMMTHMAEPKTLLEECRKMQSYGAEGVVLMDSAGSLLPDGVKSRIELLADGLDIPVGFHAHNNLGMAIANSITAVQAGARILDGCIRGFGAGAGNAQLEVLVAVLLKMGYDMGIDLYRILELSEVAEKQLTKGTPNIQPTSIVSGMAGVTSTYKHPVERISQQYGVDPRDVFFELGRRQVVNGQEDLIIEVAMNLVQNNGTAQ